MTTHLTAGQQAWLKAELEQRRDALSRQLGDHLHGQSLSERAHEVARQDADDAPQRAPERELAMALSDRERLELRAAAAALTRLQQGRYGQCADCDEAIAFDRLKAEPWALRCIACERRQEHQRR